MKFLISGGSGLIGRSLTQSLLSNGHAVWILTRREVRPSLTADNPTFVQWDGTTTRDWDTLVPKMDGIINLAGEPLARWPWTKARKRRFWDSRVQAGKVLTEAIQKSWPRPRTFIQVSGINHYGLHGDLADESTPAGDDFLSRLTVAWEDSTADVERMSIRRCVVRLGVVLERSGGLFPLMALPVRMFLGGPLGSGKQAIPWIHLQDVVGAIRFLLENEQTSGVYNLVAPDTVTNGDFYHALAKAMRRPYWFPTPSIMLKSILGEMSVLILEGRAARPKRLLETGFHFDYGDLSSAFRHLSGGREK